MQTQNERLIATIRNTNNTELALQTAVQIIIDFLQQSVSSEAQALSCPQEHD